MDEFDRSKLLADHCRHITTLSTAAILAIGAFFDKVANSHGVILFVTFSLGTFVFAIIFALLAQAFIVEALSPPPKRNTKLAAFDYFYRSALVAFSIAITLLFMSLMMGLHTYSFKQFPPG